MSPRRWLLSAAAALMAIGQPTAAHAEEASELDELLSQTVVTTASKASETGSMAPATSITITAEDLRLYGIRSLDEAVDFLSMGVATSKSPRGSDIGSRGVTLSGDGGSHFLLLLNGHTMNSPLFGSAPFDRGAGIPMEMVDHIEVILGPGSVLYGSNAMLGVINVITKRAKDFEGLHAVAESEVGKSYRASVAGGWRISKGKTPLEVTTGFEYYQLYGPSFRYGPQTGVVDFMRSTPMKTTPNGPADGIWGGRATESYRAQVPAGLLRLLYGDLELNVHARLSKRSAPYNQHDLDGQTFFDDPSAYQLDRQAFADLAYQTAVSSVVQVSVRGFGDLYDYQRYAGTANGGTCPFVDGTCRFRFVGKSRMVGGEAQTSFDWLKNQKLVTLLGADVRVRDVQGKSDLLDYRTDAYVAPSIGIIDAQDMILAGYLQQTWQPASWLGLNVGARAERDRRFDPMLLPRAAVMTKPWRDGTFKVTYSEAFRAPSWGESLYSSWSQIRAFGLKPEKVRGVEGSMEQAFGSHRLLFGVFRSWWTNMIEPYKLNETEGLSYSAGGLLSPYIVTGFQYRNVSTIDDYGFNGGLQGTLLDDGKLRYGFNVTGVHSWRNDPATGSHPVPVAPSFFGNARVSYALPGAWPTFALGVHWLSKRVADQSFTQAFLQEPYAPAMAEIRGTILGDVPAVKGLSYRLTANIATASRAAHVVGPNNHSGFDSATGMFTRYMPYELAPVDRFRVGIDLKYDVMP